MPFSPQTAVSHRIKEQWDSNEIMRNASIVAENMRGKRISPLFYEGKVVYISM